MQTSQFRIVPLPSAVAAAAREKARAGAADHAIVRADAPNTCPCRHCLEWAAAGEEVILFPFDSIARGRPYSETGPIFVHAGECKPYSATTQYPAAFRNGRVLRAYDGEQNMIDAEIVNGSEPEDVVARLFGNPATSFLQARSATRGCFTFRIERA